MEKSFLWPYLLYLNVSLAICAMLLIVYYLTQARFSNPLSGITYNRLTLLPYILVFCALIFYVLSNITAEYTNCSFQEHEDCTAQSFYLIGQTIFVQTALYVQTLEWILLRRMVIFQSDTPFDELAVKASNYRQQERRTFIICTACYTTLLLFYLVILLSDLVYDWDQRDNINYPIQVMIISSSGMLSLFMMTSVVTVLCLLDFTLKTK